MRWKLEDYKKVVMDVCRLFNENNVIHPTALTALTYIMSQIIRRAPSDVEGVLAETIEALTFLVNHEEVEDN